MPISVWMQLQVGPGVAQHQEPQGLARVPGPAWLRRQQRREENRRQEAEKAKEDKAEKEVPVEKAVTNGPAKNDDVSKLNDEICTDAYYFKKVSSEVAEKVIEKKMCSVDFYPKDLNKIEEFREDIETYFKGRNDLIEEVIDSRIEDSGGTLQFSLSTSSLLLMWTL